MHTPANRHRRTLLPNLMKTTIPRYARLIRLDKPIGTLLLLWPTLWALWIANSGIPSMHLLLVFVLGVFFTRSAGCIINDCADRDIDRYVDRTRHRPITSGEVTVEQALGFMAVLLLLAFMLVLTANHLTVLLAFAGVLLAFIYPFMKRYTYVPQFFLGLAFSWGIPMAFAATTNTVPAIAWLLFLANIVWVLIYDTMYAMVDREDDIRIGVKSTAILFAEADTTIIGIMQCMFIVILLFIGQQLKLDMFYYSSLAFVVLFFIYQQFLLKDRTAGKCLQAFLSNNYLGMTLFLAIFVSYV